MINLYKKFNFSNSELKESSKVVVVKKDIGKCGVIVDDVNEVTTVNEDAIDTSASVVSIVSRKYMKGIIRERENLIMLLDLNKVLLEEEEALVFEGME